MANCAAGNRRRAPNLNSDDRRTQYRALRVPSKTAVAAPAQMLPPAPTMTTRANCDAPVNIKSDRATVCSSDNPDVVEIAPNDRA